MPKTYFHNNWYKATENVPLEFSCIRTIFRLKEHNNKKEKRKEKKRIFFKTWTGSDNAYPPTHPISFKRVGKHDDSTGSILPNNFPEIF